jgi:hypothetical protein
VSTFWRPWVQNIACALNFSRGSDKWLPKSNQTWRRWQQVLPKRCRSARPRGFTTHKNIDIFTAGRTTYRITCWWERHLDVQEGEELQLLCGFFLLKRVKLRFEIHNFLDRTSRFSGYYSCFVFRRSRVQISARVRVILRVFMVFQSYSKYKYRDSTLNQPTIASFLILSLSLDVRSYSAELLTESLNKPQIKWWRCCSCRFGSVQLS